MLAPRPVAPALGRTGLTLIELISVLVILGILAAMGTRQYSEVRYQAQVARAIGDLRAIQTDLLPIEIGGQPLPGSLNEIGRGGMVDPWGEPYVYFPFPPTKAGEPPAGSRRDRFLVPINSTYDLYSKGRDRVTNITLTSPAGRDDVVRGNDGGFIGLGSRF